VLKDIWDSKAGLFDARDGHELLTVPGKVVLAARDRREFVWSDGSGWARAEFDPASGVEVIPVHEERKAPFQLAFSPDGRWLAWGNWQATDAFVLDLRSQSAPHRFVIPGTATARFSPDCQSLVLCGPTEIQVVEPGTWRVRHSIGRPLSGELPARVGWEHLASQDFYL
jgi:hypothetical protein